jgi:internalin A
MVSICRSHPEAGIKWDLTDSQRVVVSGIDRLAMNVEDGRLVRLDLSNFKLKGTLSLREIPGLEVLNITGPGLTEVVIDRLPDLVSLSMDNLSLKAGRNVLTLDNLPKLSSLKIVKSGLSDLCSLSGLRNLKDLDLSFNSISELSPLSLLTKLVKLDLNFNFIEDIIHLTDLSHLKEIDLSHNRLNNVELLCIIESLRSLTVSDNAMSEISSIRLFTQLKELRLKNCSVSDLDFLSSLTNLELLVLRDNLIVDLKGIDALENIKYLDLSLNRITNLDRISGLTKLRSLFLSKNKIKDVEPVSTLKRLIELDLSWNHIDNLLGLNKLLHLNYLNLKHNRLTNIDPLKNLVGLKELNLSQNTKLGQAHIQDVLTDRSIVLTEESQEEPHEEANSYDDDDGHLPSSQNDPNVHILSVDDIESFQSEPKFKALSSKIRSMVLDKIIHKAFQEAFGVSMDEINPADDDESQKEDSDKSATGKVRRYQKPSDLKLVKTTSKSAESESQKKNNDANRLPDFLKDSDQDDDDENGFDPLDFLRFIESEMSNNDDDDDDDDNEDGENWPDFREANSDDSPDDGVVYNSIDEIEDLPPEIRQVLKQLGGEPTQIKVRALKPWTNIDDLNLPKGTIVIRCQVEAPPEDFDFDDNFDKSEQPKRRPHFINPGVRTHRVLKEGVINPAKADSVFPFFKPPKKQPGSSGQNGDDDADYKSLEQIFMMLNFNPSKYSIH